MRLIAPLLIALALGACTPIVSQKAATPPAGFAGPRFEADAMVSFDGQRLGLSRWDASGEPWAVIVALHGMNDYANAFHMAGPAWAQQGVSTIAYDQRGFGRSPQRGVWGGRDLMAEDLRTAVALARRESPNALIVVLGESMGGAVAAYAFASDRPPQADRLILSAPGVWGFSEQPILNRVLLVLAARITGPKVYTPPKWVTDKISPTDNREELIAMGKDPLMIWGSRSDTLYGLVRLMGEGADAVGKAAPPTLYLYGENDQIIPKNAALRAGRRLRPADRSAYYPQGWHLLTRDHAGPVVRADIVAFIRDPAAPLPSRAPALPAPRLKAAPDSVAAR